MMKCSSIITRTSSNKCLTKFVKQKCTKTEIELNHFIANYSN